MMETLKGPRLGAKQHFIAVLESQGVLNRQLEYLPEDEELTERRIRGEGLTRPELAVLLSYSKIVLYQQLLASDLPEDPYLSRELIRYFPVALQDRFAGVMQEHRLKREIIATQVTNSIINRMGASFALRMHEDTAQTFAVAKAFTVAREILSGVLVAGGSPGQQGRGRPADQRLMSMWLLLRQATMGSAGTAQYQAGGTAGAGIIGHARLGADGGDRASSTFNGRKPGWGLSAGLASNGHAQSPVSC
jgi:glutamate dehydrogenase